MVESYKPTSAMISNAKRGLALRDEHGRGGTMVGIARARDIVNGKNLPLRTVKRMFSFFSRHEVDKQADGWQTSDENYPSNGLIAWLLWGGDSGFSWSKKIVNQAKNKERAISVGNIYTKAQETLREDHDDYIYIHDIYFTEDDSFVIFSEEGELYKASFDISGDEVVFDDPIKVVTEFKEVRSTIQVFRSNENKLRFVGVASTAVLNRVGEIDSTLLYDSMISRFKSGQPVNFYHIKSENSVMGNVVDIQRSGHQLILFGEIDESTLLGEHAEQALSTGDYGMSIEFYPTASEELEVGEAKIRTYTEGIFAGVAILKESDCASLFTNVLV